MKMKTQQKTSIRSLNNLQGVHKWATRHHLDLKGVKQPAPQVTQHQFSQTFFKTVMLEILTLSYQRQALLLQMKATTREVRQWIRKLWISYGYKLFLEACKHHHGFEFLLLFSKYDQTKVNGLTYNEKGAKEMNFIKTQ